MFLFTSFVNQGSQGFPVLSAGSNIPIAVASLMLVSFNRRLVEYDN